ncbi:glycosyltransferase [Amnibacterium endophyticum]|uniref:Glycosyltransferase n=1 Tax=Amnibacterium endophyticum TaxID=2109337 RepID=A0ABW4L9H7_9MICO
MPTSVTAILVAAEGEHRLRAVLDALTQQTRMPDRLVVVQLGADPATASAIAAIEPTVQARVHGRAGFGQAVETGVRAAGLGPEDGQWLWLLSTDTAPEPRALERLLQAVEAAPSVVVAGPKQMQWEAPEYLHAFGETMTPGGTAVELAEPELDQAQYDRLSDVMAVDAGGMLVQERAWRALGGFDLALPAYDDALDFCVRARLAGHRVQLVPGARVRAAGLESPGARLLGGPSTLGRRTRFRREAQLHRRLVYASLPLVVLHWLSLLPIAVARALGQLLRKQPEAAPAELLAALVVLSRVSAVARSRSRIARTRTVGWPALAALRQPWKDVRYRRALARENGRPVERHEPIRFLTGGGLATTVGVGAVSAMLFTPLIGADALSGGTLLPLGSFHNLWRSIGWGVRPLGEGFVGPADPFAVVLALLGSLTPWHPSAAVVGLWVLALPIAAAGGWLATARFTRRAPLRVVGALLWAASPTLLLALDQGRIAGVLVHLAAPFALLAALSVRRSWTASAWLGLLGALIAACSPSLLPLLAATWLAAVVIGRRRRRDGGRVRRVLPLPLPTLVLFAPLIAEQALHGRLLGVLADPGPVATAEPEAHVLGLPEQLSTALQLVVGWPAWTERSWEALTEPLGLTGAASAIFVWSLGAPLLLLALVGLFWPGRSLPMRIGVAGVGGLVAAVLATRLLVVADGEVPIPAWSGAGLSLAWLAVLEAAVVGLDRLSAGAVVPLPGRPGRLASQVRALGAAGVGFTAVLALLAAASPLLVGVLLGTSQVRPGTSATVPPLVAAESRTVPDLGLLTLQPQEDGGFRKRLYRGEGQTMERTSTLTSTAGFGESRALARLAAGLVQPTGDDLRASLDRFRIGYVLLVPGAGDATGRAALAEAQAVLGANPLLTSVSSTASGTLYRFGGLDPEATGEVVRRGPSNTGTPLGLLVLAVQGLVLGLTFLLALPTRRLATRFRPQAAVAPHRLDVRSIERSPLPPEVQALRPEQAATVQREEVPAWR